MQPLDISVSVDTWGMRLVSLPKVGDFTERDSVSVLAHRVSIDYADYT